MVVWSKLCVSVIAFVIIGTRHLSVGQVCRGQCERRAHIATGP